MDASPNAMATFISTLDGQSSGLVSVSPALGVGTSTAPVIRGTSFTLTNTLSLTIGAQGTAVLNAATIAETPEPTTLALALSGLSILGLGAYRRRKRS
jgi:Flp pilus assembly protein TadG